jgi:hypothetical protein
LTTYRTMTDSLAVGHIGDDAKLEQVQHA